tara:strand:+ start:268 stop:411 length:144 start_codon:yes stop_codon:yes gene_type:complete
MVVTRTLHVKSKLLQEIQQIEAQIRSHENSIKNLKKRLKKNEVMKNE